MLRWERKRLWILQNAVPGASNWVTKESPLPPFFNHIYSPGLQFGWKPRDARPRYAGTTKEMDQGGPAGQGQGGGGRAGTTKAMGLPKTPRKSLSPQRFGSSPWQH